jgi:undecaprenyl-diphosphatase
MPTERTLRGPHLPAAARPRAQALLGLAVIAAVLLLAAWVRFGASNQPIAVDLPWHDAMASLRTAAVLKVAAVLALVGGVQVMFPLVAVLAAVLLLRRRLLAAWTVVATSLAAEGAALVLKGVVSRPRPPGSTEATADAFPSGHTTLAAAVAFALALLFDRAIGWVLAVAWTVLMAWSRTYILAHWLSDTVAGALLGLAMALLVWGLTRWGLALRDQRRARAGVPLIARSGITAETSGSSAAG